MSEQYCLFHNIVLILQLLSGTEYHGKFLKPQSFEAFAVTLLSAVAALEPDWRPKCLQMNSPAAITLPRSTPVLIPNPLSMHVHYVLGCDVPWRTLRVRAAAKAGHGGVHNADPHLIEHRIMSDHSFTFGWWSGQCFKCVGNLWPGERWECLKEIARRCRGNGQQASPQEQRTWQPQALEPRCLDRWEKLKRFRIRLQ